MKQLTGLYINDAEITKKKATKKSSKKKGASSVASSGAGAEAAPKPIDVSKLMNNSSSDAKQVPNIILHLKCHIKDLNSTQLLDQYEYNPSVPPEIVAYNKNDNSYFLLDEQNPNNDNCTLSNELEREGGAATASKDPATTTQETDAATINTKLKKLKVALYKNAPPDDKQSACFWCTCDYENAPCYIPKYEIDNSIHAYGSFCSPECAAGFLLFEEIDDSTKFERLYLLNNIYGKIYNYESNIKPAPKPFYLLNKFYGNLTIEEFRALSREKKNYKQLLVIERPLTRILPELHEEKDKSITSASCSGMYRVKRQSDSAGRQTKNDILKDTFGFQ